MSLTAAIGSLGEPLQLIANPLCAAAGSGGATGADSTEDTLSTQKVPPYVVGFSNPGPAGLGAVKGKVIEIFAWGKIAAQTGNKTIKVYFGATVVATVVGTGANDGVWKASAKVVITGDGKPAAQIAFGEAVIVTTGGTPVSKTTLTQSAPAEDLYLPVDVKVTGQSSNSGAADVTCDGVIIRA